LLGKLPPGKDHVHQVLFIVLSLAGFSSFVPLAYFVGVTLARSTATRGSAEEDLT
jgi:hypothetical protein